MRFFIDANILISILNKEYPSYVYTTRILSLTGHKRYTFITTSVALAIAYYFAEKKHGHSIAKKKIDTLSNHIEIADCGKRETTFALQNKQVHDFEDGLQYYAALHSKCSCIITNDIEGFYFSEMEVMRPESFLNKYLG
jgi:predicted nucleic acid-binding protein